MPSSRSSTPNIRIAIVRDGVLVTHHFDAPEAERFEKRFHNLVVRKWLMGRGTVRYGN